MKTDEVLQQTFWMRNFLVSVLIILLFTPHLHAALIHWEPIGFSAGGLFPVIAVDPVETNILYLGADVSGMYKSVDYGESWTHINAGLGSREISSFAIDPSNHRHLWAGTPMGLYASQNGGESWALANADIQCFKHVNYHGITISRDGQTILVASHDVNDEPDGFGGGDFSGQLYRSADGGTTWTIVTQFPGKRIPSVYLGQAAWPSVLSTSTNAGQSWQGGNVPDSYTFDPVHAPHQTWNDPWQAVISIAVDPQNSDRLYSTTWWGVWRSDDGGKSWHEKVVGTQNTCLKKTPGSGESEEDRLIKCLEVDPTDSKRLFAGLYWDGLWYSENGGKQWHLARGDGVDLDYSSVQDIVALADGTIFAAYDDGLYKSVDHGQTFSRAFPELPNLGEDTVEYVSSIAVNPSDPNEIFVSTAKTYPVWFNRGAVWHSKNGGAEWTEITGDLPVKNVVDLTYRDGSLYAATWCANVYRTDISTGGHAPSSGQTARTSKNIWRPEPGTRWQWQLSGEIDTSFEVNMYDIDLVNTPQNIIDQLHAEGRKVICYFSAGSWENWRSDADQFPESVTGKALDEWPDEKWLDIRQIDVLAPIMEARLNLARQKRCDGVEPDNVDGYVNNSGFPMNYGDQLKYNIWLANQAHARGLSIGLKNDLEQVKDLVPYFDWALNEECFQYDECELLLPFVEADKAVFGVEYEGNPASFCPQANAMNFNWLKKHWDLDAWRQACR